MAALFSAAHLSRISSVLTLFFHRLCYNIFYGVGYYTHSTMAGFIRLEPRDLDEDPTNLTVTLSMPKQYVEKDSIRIPPFSTNSTITEYTIGSVEENGENYTISIYFTVYDRTQTLMLPFTLSFLDDVVPDNYRLPVTASVSGGDAAAPTIYRPLYKDWEIQKFVNSNRLDAFGKDGAEVVVTPQEEGGNPYLDDLTYVDFAFIVNKYTNDQCSLADLRDARSVTLTDTLPTYTDRNGVSRIAVFDADQNPGWTLSEDGKTISRTYTGEHSAEILLQIYNDALHLRFPGLQFTALADDGTLMAELSNSVALTAIPSGEAPGETHPEADDPLRFRLTTDPTAQGKFTKGAEKGDIYDVEVYKTNPYPWSLALSNDKSQPLRHIVIQDRTIVEDGETNDKIAYAFSDATLIAAQSMYAEKFIAPAGSDSWSKQGLLVKAGSDFDYLLEIVNETAAVHTGLTVYDTLPRIGDPNLFGASGRGSEFPVRLRGAITPPEGYTVYYTTSPEVYPHSMEEMVDSDIWTTSITDYASVTAFKLVAGEGTVLVGNSTFRVRIPVCAPKTFDEDSMALLRAKVDQDQASGTVSWLQAVNAFGLRTVQTPTVKGSNTVPDGFLDTHVSVAVTITQNPVTLAYSVTFSGDHTGLGTSADPLCIENHGAYVLPKTGGRGTAAFYIPGAFLLLSAAALPDLRKRRSRKH